MAISRKDMVILTVLFNVVVLVGVIATAHQLTRAPAPEQEIAYNEPPLQTIDAPKEEPQVSFDEIDTLLEEYAPESKEKKEKPVKKEVVQKKQEILYVIRQGDNPWKIAKKFHMSFEKLLELNGLDQEKAKNLKAGQTLKVQEGK